MTLVKDSEMKVKMSIRLCLLLSIFILPISCGVRIEKSQLVDQNNLYKVTRIENCAGAYLIHIGAVSDNTRYTIVSVKDASCIRCCRLRKGSIYTMFLVPYYESHYARMEGYNHSVVIEGQKISFIENKFTGEIVTTKNIKGLCYIQNKSL